MDTKRLADAVTGLLAETYALMGKTQSCHWNVTGPHFASYHALFEQQYNDLFVAVDEIAERVRSLGHTAPSGLQALAKAATLRDADPAASAEDMVRDLMAANRQLGEVAHRLEHLADDEDDEVTTDLAVQRMAAHAKAAWMLEATLGRPTKTAAAAKPAEAKVEKKPEKKPEPKKPEPKKPEAKKPEPKKEAKPVASNGRPKKAIKAAG
jgi:starvation-inducible DNA-binding protein